MKRVLRFVLTHRKSGSFRNSVKMKQRQTPRVCTFSKLHIGVESGLLVLRSWAMPDATMRERVTLRLPLFLYMLL